MFDCLNVAVNVDKLMILLNILNLYMGILSWFESKGENVSNYKENQSKISYIKKKWKWNILENKIFKYFSGQDYFVIWSVLIIN